MEPVQKLKASLRCGYLPHHEALSFFGGSQHSLNVRIHRLRLSGVRIGTVCEGRKIVGYFALDGAA
jgi:hypothetical protein